MSVIATLSALAFRPLINTAADFLNVPLDDKATENVAGTVANLLHSRFVDSSRKMSEALRRASDQAWRALEVALAGETLWSRLGRADDKVFRHQVRLFLDGVRDSLPLPPADFRACCL